MRDLSLFLIKNSLGGKMKKGLRNFCNDDGSTSTLNQHHKTTSCTPGPAAAAAGDHHTTASNPAVPAVPSPTNYNYYLKKNNNSNIASSNYFDNSDHDQKSPPPTLEEMILRLDLEEELIARSKYSKLKDYNKYKYHKGRMSSVNNSDILRSARNALNQYPRFSLDGKDAMYRSSFRNSLDIDNDINILEMGKQPAAKAAAGGRKSACCSDYDYAYAGRLRSGKVAYDENDTRSTSLLQCSLPATLAGERIVWCKPGVVAKLMGLEAMPVPATAAAVISTSTTTSSSKLDQKLGIIDVVNMKRRPNLMMRRKAQDQRHERDQRRVVTNYRDINNANGTGTQCDHRIFINKKAAAGKRTSTAASSSCTTSKTTSAAYDNNNYYVIAPGVANS